MKARKRGKEKWLTNKSENLVGDKKGSSPGSLFYRRRPEALGHFYYDITDNVGRFITPVGGIGEMAIDLPHF